MIFSPARFGFSLLSLLGLATVMTACGDDSEKMDLSVVPDMTVVVVVPHNFQQINDDILRPGCASFSVCHTTYAALATPLDLCSSPLTTSDGTDLCLSNATLAGTYKALLDVPAANKQAKDEGLTLVKPCDPDHSFLLTKLNLPVSATDATVGYGQHMPKDSPSLAPEQLTAIHDWIARGAHFNEPADVTGTDCVMGDGG